MLYFGFDKKKSQLKISSFDGPATEFQIRHFAMGKEQAKALLKHQYYGVGFDKFFTPHFGEGVAAYSAGALVLLANQNDKWTRYLFDVEDATVKIDEHTLPDIRNVINYRTDAYICDNKIFL